MVQGQGKKNGPRLSVLLDDDRLLVLVQTVEDRPQVVARLESGDFHCQILLSTARPADFHRTPFQTVHGHFRTRLRRFTVALKPTKPEGLETLAGPMGGLPRTQVPAPT